MGTIAVNDPNLQIIGGPYGGASGNGLSAILTGSSSLTWCCPNYFRFALVHTGSDTATLNFSSNAMSAIIKVVVDGTLISQTSISGTTSLGLGTYPAGTHLYDINIIGGAYGNWSSALSSQLFNLLSITTANGALTTPVVGAPTLLAMCYGDSRNAGSSIDGSGTQDFSISGLPALARAMGCDLSAMVMPGWGWGVSPKGYTGGEPPPLFTPGNDSLSGYDKIMSGQSRVFPSNLKWVFFHGFGLNDTDNTAIPSQLTPAQLVTRISLTLAALRAVIPATCKIGVINSWSGSVGQTNGWGDPAVLTATTASGVQTYLANAVAANTPDPFTYICYDPMDQIAKTYYSNWYYGGSIVYFCADGVHTLVQGTPTVAAFGAASLIAATLPTGPPIAWNGGMA
jgi:hypothetical protein